LYNQPISKQSSLKYFGIIFDDSGVAKGGAGLFALLAPVVRYKLIFKSTFNSSFFVLESLA